MNNILNLQEKEEFRISVNVNKSMVSSTNEIINKVVYILIFII